MMRVKYLLPGYHNESICLRGDQEAQAFHNRKLISVMQQHLRINIDQYNISSQYSLLLSQRYFSYF